MRKILFTPKAPLAEASSLLIAIPFDTPEQRVGKIEVSGVSGSQEVVALNSGQRALRIDVAAGQKPVVEISFHDEAGGFPDWLFRPTGGQHERASDELSAHVEALAPRHLPPAERVLRIVRHVEERFHYGLRDVGLGDDTESLPALVCGTHAGTCIDTHSYAVAALRTSGIDAAYVSGVFFDQGCDETVPGHCWFVVRAENSPHHWDISHFLKYGLGPVRPVLNPLPGLRQALSAGRDLVFDGPDGACEIPVLSGFTHLAGPLRGSKLPTSVRLS
jgi:hypothetical protein